MASVLTFTTIVIVVVTSVSSEQRNFQRYANHLQKAIPNLWRHDKEDLGGRLDTVARWHKIEDAEPPLLSLRQQQESVWQGWSKRNRLAAMEGARNSELQKVRRHLLEQKLKLQKLRPKREMVQPQVKPKQNLRPKRSVNEIKSGNEGKVLEMESEQNKRTKREVVIPQPQLGAVGQFLDQPDTNTQYQEKVNEKRDKRQILYLIQERPAEMFFKGPRTTRNPFIRETNIADYEMEIEKPDDLVQRPVPLTASEEIDTDSYMINEEASEFSKIISEFYLTTSDETWPEIQQFAENVLKPLSELLQRNEDKWEEKNTKEEQDFKEPKTVNFGNSTTDWNKMSSLKNSLEDLVHRRIKRRAGRVLERGKTLWRKRAKKRKQRLRRFEAKRLRMRTHARRVRKQQKHKQERLQRHYARMNLTTLLPGHIGTNVDINAGEANETDEKTTGSHRESDKALTKIKEDGKKTNKKEDEYESVEHVESEEDNDDSDEESYYDSDDDDSPDDGNDSYEEYEDSEDGGSYEDIEYENIDNTTEKKNNKNTKKEKITIKSNKQLRI